MLQGAAKRFAELGYDTVLISQYGGCSETCEPYQGKVYIDDVFTIWNGERSGDFGKSNYCDKWFMLLSVAIRGGLFHPNCRHTMGQYIEGLTKIPQPIPADKIREQRALEEKQRAMERKIRALKRKVEGTQDEKKVKEYKRKLRKEQGKLREFIKEHDDVLRRDYSREKIYSGKGEPKQTAPRTEEAPMSKLPENATPQLPEVTQDSPKAKKIMSEGVDVTKNIYVKGGFEKTVAIPDDIKNAIVSSIEKIQREYDVKIDEFSLEDISREYGKVPFQFCPINENGKFKSKFLINEGFNWEMNLDKMNERIYNRNYKKGVLASQNINDLIAHEMAHFMSFQSCESYNDFLLRERQLRSLYISGVSRYSDALEDGAETIAEGFVRIRNNETVDDRVKSLVNEYVERWK